jgi:hypothetical protein
MTQEQAEALQVGTAVVANGQTGVVDRVSGTGEIFVWFGTTHPEDNTMRVGVVGYQPGEVESA